MLIYLAYHGRSWYAGQGTNTYILTTCILFIIVSYYSYGSNATGSGYWQLLRFRVAHSLQPDGDSGPERIMAAQVARDVTFALNLKAQQGPALLLIIKLVQIANTGGNIPIAIGLYDNDAAADCRSRVVPQISKVLHHGGKSIAYGLLLRRRRR